MPIYEYRCGNCKRRVSIFFRSFSATTEPRCPNCDSDQLTRLVSRVAQLKSEDARLEAMSDPSNFGDVDENDPRSVAKFMRKMGDEMGSEELGPDFNEMVERMESGESPEEIEKSMPGPGGEGMGDTGGEDSGLM